MTERLYYTDAHLREFDAAVVRVEREKERSLLWLDRTAFYPTSGGQPFDTGRLGPMTVVDVFEDAAGDIVHAVEADPPPVGQTLHGTIDWTRRFDHMQQHTGQHLLSAAFERTCGAPTVSFHLGSDTSTIDLAREATPAQIAAAENEANRVVWEDRPVAIRFVSEEAAAALPLRKAPPSRGGTLRVVDIEQFDLSACGGTHVGRTGAVGIIAVAAWERFKGGQRVQFVCGGRALAQFRQLRDVVHASVSALSVVPADLAPAIDRVQMEAKEQRRTITELHAELAGFRAQQLADRAAATDRARVVAEVVDADAAALKSLASAIVCRPGFLVVLVSAATPALLVVARSADVTLAANELVAQLASEFGGRGGGRPDFAQAGGLAASGAAILTAAKRTLRI